MRVLVVEDDALLGDGVQAGLRQRGFTVDWLCDGELARLALSEDVFDVVVLDLGLPKVAGMTLLEDMRKTGLAVPVLILTAQDAQASKVQALDAGADDYLVKPFDLDELAARLRALVRRNSGLAAPKLSVGDICLDPAARRVTISCVPVDLSAREFTLLHVLMQYPSKVHSRAELETALYGWAEGVESNAIEVHVHHLRRKLGAHAIETVRGAGYRMLHGG